LRVEIIITDSVTVGYKLILEEEKNKQMCILHDAIKLLLIRHNQYGAMFRNTRPSDIVT